MDKAYFICDESGAKGYSENREKYEGEIGVIAGFIIPESYILEVRLELDLIRDKYLTEGKLHITDLESKQQEQLRYDIFEYIIGKQIPCVYEAIHVEGFYENSKFLTGLIEEFKKSSHSKIKTSNNPRKELLQTELFQGAFGKAVAFCIDFINKETQLIIITDQIDYSIKKKYQSAAERLLSIGEIESSKDITAFNSETKEILKGNITQTINDPHGVLGDFSGISFKIEIEDSSLTLAADVVANSLNYHFKNREGKLIGDSLHTVVAIKNHPLQSLIYGTWVENDIKYFSDAIYQHPSNKSK